jgi:hypothetical protein
MMPLTRPHLLLVAAALGLAALVRPAAAHASDVAGTYDVTFAEVANNCEQEALTLDKSRLTIEGREGDRLVARIPGVPAMTGAERRGGQFRAEVRASSSPIADARARYSVAGRVRGGQAQFVFIAEYYRGARPLCTQSWSGAGGAGEQAARPRSSTSLVFELAELLLAGALATPPR